MNYHTRRGASARRPNSYGELLDQPTHARRDDGRVILHVGDLTPTCRDCGRGQLQWAEAGYVPWHRICDWCGSHWDLHPLGIGIGLIPVTEEPVCGWPQRRDVCRHADAHRCGERAAGMDEVAAAAAGLHDKLRCACPCHVPPSQRRVVGVQPSIWCDGSGWVALDPSWPITATNRELAAWARLPWLRPEDAEMDPAPATWGQLLELIGEAHVEAARAEQDRTLGVPCVPACWARRARIYSR